MMDELVPFGSRPYLMLLSLLCFSRAMDFLSTWVATPNLVLEGNPLAKWLGWKLGPVINLILCFTLAFWPLVAIIIITNSLLVAARNFQSAWLMRSMGEVYYREWYIERMCHTSLPLYLLCLLGQTLLTASVGAALMLFSPFPSIPSAIGLGVIAYALTVLFYTSLSLWRIRRTLQRAE
jgi:hypothetical protein